jgi:hypothetical protein
MAELLILLKDKVHPDPFINNRDCPKRGDIIISMKDEHNWGPKEGLPTFFILKIPDLDPEVAQKYTVPDYMFGPTDPKRVRRYKFFLRIDGSDLPQSVKTEIRDTGEYTTTLSVIKRFIRNKVTDLDEG